MRARAIAAAALLAVLLVNAAAQADEVRDAVRMLLEKRAACQVMVEFDLKRADGSGGSEVKLQGTIVRADGLVLVTNAKQVDPPLGSRNEKPLGFKVRFPGDKLVDATFVGKDDELNLALVRLNLSADGLPEFHPTAFAEVVQIGAGDQLIVLRRLDQSDEDAMDYKLLRVSTVIERPGLPAEYRVLGNLGGIDGCPAYTLDGRLMGFVAGATRVRGRRGSFRVVNGRLEAVPAGGGDGHPTRLLDATVVTEFLSDPSRFARRDCWLGVSGVQALTKPLAEALGIEEVGGLVVGEVSEQSPAARAGILAGDVIRVFDDERITTEKDRDIVSFRKRIKRAKSGATHRVTVLRDSGGGYALVAIEVTIEEAPLSENEVPDYHDEEFGLKLKPLTRDFLERTRLPVDSKGVRVTSVEPASWASIAGIRAGDVIQKMVLKPCPDLKSYQTIMGELLLTRDSEVCYNVTRQRKSLFLCVRPDWDSVPEAGQENGPKDAGK